MHSNLEIIWMSNHCVFKYKLKKGLKRRWTFVMYAYATAWIYANKYKTTYYGGAWRFRPSFTKCKCLTANFNQLEHTFFGCVCIGIYFCFCMTWQWNFLLFFPIFFIKIAQYIIITTQQKHSHRTYISIFKTV